MCKRLPQGVGTISTPGKPHSGNFFSRLFSASQTCFYRSQHFLKKSISYGSSGQSDTGKRLVNGSSSLDLGAKKCDLTCVFPFKSHFFLKSYFFILRLIDMTLSLFKTYAEMCVCITYTESVSLCVIYIDKICISVFYIHRICII